VGDGDNKNAFVYLGIAMLPGRDLATKNKIGEKGVILLNDFFKPIIAAQSFYCQPTLEILELTHDYR